MKVWGRVRRNNKTVAECVIEIAAKSSAEIEDWCEPIGEICHEMDLSRPIILEKHIADFNKFSHANFNPTDFVEQVMFDGLEIELF